MSLSLRVVERYVPLIVDLPLALVVTMNVVLDAPAGIVAVGGTCATLVSLLLKVTTAPFGGAAPFKINVPVAVLPPLTVFGLTVNEVRDATDTVRFVVVLLTPYTAVIVTEVDEATP